jgi:hypothetical protein
MAMFAVVLVRDANGYIGRSDHVGLRAICKNKQDDAVR